LLAERTAQKETMAAAEERRRKEKRDVAVAIILAVVTFILTLFLKVFWAGIAFLIGLFFLASYLGNLERMVGIQRVKVIKIQASVIVIGIGVGFVVLYPFWRQEQAAALEGDLIGGGNPELLENGAIPWVQIADTKSVMIMAPNGKGQPYFSPFKDDADFLVESGTKGPLISTVVRDRGGNMIVEIKQNHWRVYPPYCSEKNYTDLAFEAKDSSGHVLIQFRFVGGPPRVQVQGEWWTNESRGIRIVKGADRNGYVVPLVPDNQHNDKLIKPIFKYTSKNHWGEFDKNSALSDVMPKL
jgi:hypothetical protein